MYLEVLLRWPIYIKVYLSDKGREAYPWATGKNEQADISRAIFRCFCIFATLISKNLQYRQTEYEGIYAEG